MKLIALSSLVIASAVLSADEPTGTEHHFAPTTIYRKHCESGYNYETFGVGFQYTYHRPWGVNARLNYLTNFSDKTILLEKEFELFFRYVVAESHNLYPIFSSRFSSHRVHADEFSDTYAYKGAALLGLGWEFKAVDNVMITLEGSVFRDLENILLVKETDKFWGHAYSNPFGAKGKLAVAYKWQDNFSSSAEGYYMRSFDDCYWETGAKVALNWAF